MIFAAAKQNLPKAGFISHKIVIFTFDGFENQETYCLFVAALVFGAVGSRSWHGSYLGEDRINCPICYFVDNTPFFLAVSSFSLLAVLLLLVLVLLKYEAAPIRWADHTIPSRAPPVFI